MNPLLPAAWYHHEKTDTWQLLAIDDGLTCIATVRPSHGLWRWSIQAHPHAYGAAHTHRHAILAVEHILEPQHTLILRSPTHPHRSRLDTHTSLLAILCAGPHHSNPDDLSATLSQTSDLITHLVRTGYQPSPALHRIHSTLRNWSGKN
jgi:hypothetical protein